MSDAKKCDRCGKLFEPYNIDTGYKVPSRYTSILVKNISLAKETYKEFGEYDLCKECNDSFSKWLAKTNVVKQECDEVTKENKQKGCSLFGSFDGSIDCLICTQCDECEKVTNLIKEAVSNAE